jgi:hypothetical protein
MRQIEPADAIGGFLRLHRLLRAIMKAALHFQRTSCLLAEIFVRRLRVLLP